jgi:multiple sugar transport system substrate-binding protein
MSGQSNRQWTRRGLLQAAGVASLGGLALAGCSGASSGAGARAGGSQLKWWDHYSALQGVHKTMLAQWSKSSGNQAQYSFYQGKKLAEALQLAKQSKQMPDVHSPSPALGIPVPSLIADGWFQPMQLSREALDRLPKEEMIEGVHVLDGKVYSFPIFNWRWHSAAMFVNKAVYEKAGLDPSSPPGSWDEFRAACRTVRQKVGGQTYGYMDTEAGPAKLGSLAQAAGFQGTWQGQLFRTGEYALDSDEWLNTLEFIHSLQKDKLLYPGSNTTMKADAARGRWAAGGAAFFFDGPWGPGIVAQSFKQFADQIAVAPILTAEPGARRMVYAGPGAGDSSGTAAGAFYINADSKLAAEASELLAGFTTKEYYADLAQSMDQPPLDMSLVDQAEGVHPNYKQNVKFFAEQVFLQPMPIARNPEVAKVLSEMKPVKPDFRGIATGVFSGQVPDARKAMKQLSDKLNKGLDDAIAAAKVKGAQVSRDDFAFPDWQPGMDYASKK